MFEHKRSELNILWIDTASFCVQCSVVIFMIVNDTTEIGTKSSEMSSSEIETSR